MKPQARYDQLLVEELLDELLVYDLTQNKAHRLNPTAAFVWQHCDGQTSVREIATRLHHELDLPADEELVWLALDRLERAGLLQERLTPATKAPVLTRRDLMRKLGLVGSLAVLLPVVSSIDAPAASQAASPRCGPNCTGCLDLGECEACCRTAICGSPDAAGCANEIAECLRQCEVLGK